MDIEKELLESLKALHNKFDDFSKWRATVEERCQTRREKMEGHQVTLYGQDGRDGLVSDVNDNTKYIARVRAWQLAILGSSIAAALIAVGVTILNVWKGG